jgi:hypothetical protein
VLHVSAESAGHSLLHEVADGPRRTLAAERVDVISMAAVLEQASSRGKPVIVKIDAEGSECEIVLETPVESWASVTDVFLEVHDFAPCSADTIVAKLARCGFEVSRRVADRDAELLALSRR